MNRTRTLAAVVGVLVLGVALAVWLAAGRTRDLEPRPLAPRADAAALDESAPVGVPVAELAPIEMPAAEVLTAQPGERTALAADGTPLDERDFIEVHVALPRGAPPDETLCVRVTFLRTSADEEDMSWLEIGTGENEVEVDGYFEFSFTEAKRKRMDELRLGEPVIVPVADGRALVPIAVGAPTAQVELDGRFLRAHAFVRLDQGEREVRLVPELGACLVGSVELPSGAAERGINRPSGSVQVHTTWDEIDEQVELYAWEAPVGADGRYELRGLPTGSTLVLRTELTGLTTAQARGIVLQPAELRTLDLEPRLGGRIAGRVVGEDGAPVASARVVARFDAQDVGFAIPAAPNATQTSADGTFVVLGVEPGEGQLRVSASGYLPGRSKELDVADAEEIDGVTIELSRGALIAGRVVWRTGGAARGAEVQAVAEPGHFGRAAAGAAVAGDDGAFEITGLAHGTYAVVALHVPDPRAAGEPVRWRAALSGVTADGETIELVLEPPISVRGRVTDDLGDPVQTFSVSAQLTGVGDVQVRVGASSTGTDGAFELAELYAGLWTLYATAEGHDPCTPAVLRLPEQAGEAVELVLPRQVSASGTVLGPDGSPVAGATVSVVDEDEGGWFDMDAWQQSAGSDAAGRFVLESLPSRGFSLEAQAEGWVESEELFVDLAPGESATGLVLQLRVGGVVHGEVQDELGKPIAGRTVRVGSGGGFLLFDGEAQSTTTAADGTFRLERVEPGEKTVMAGPSDEELQQSFMDDSEDEGGSAERMSALMSQLVTEEVVVLDGVETYVRLQAGAKHPVRVHGLLTEAGRPVEDTEIVVLFEEGNSPLSSMKTARTASGGAFEVTLDRPGTYAFTVLDENESPSAVFSVAIRAVEEQRVELALPTGRIEGTVRGPDGPLDGVYVALELEEGGSRLAFLAWTENAETDAQGSFAFERVAAGTYTVRAGSRNQLNPFESAPGVLASAVRGGIRVTEGARVTGVDLVLVRGGAIAGFARDAAGNPVRGASVFARGADGRLVEEHSSVITDNGGRFLCEGLPPGPVTLSARSESMAAAESPPVDVVAGEVTSVELVLAPGATLVVRVVDDAGQPVTAQVAVRDTHGFDLARLRSQEALALMMFGSDAETSTIGPLPLGIYDVSARAADGRTARTSVTLDEPGEEPLELRLPD